MYNEKIKILLVTHSSLEYGGAEEGFDDLISYFSKKENIYDIWCMYPNGSRAEKYKSLSSHSVVSERCFLPVSGRPILEYYGFVKSIFSVRKLIKSNFDGVHFDACIINVSVLIWQILFLRKYTDKLIVMVKETIYPDFLRKLVYKFINKYSDFVYFVSTSNRNEFELINNSATNTGMTYSPLNVQSTDLLFFKEAFKTNKKMLEVFTSETKSLKLICLGSLDERKNQLMIVKALSILKKSSEFKLNLFLVGDIYRNPDYVKKINIEIEKNNLKETIFIIGNLSKVEYPLLLSQCDILVISSISEGLPIVLLEAFGYKKIVVSTNFQGIDSVITDGYNGFIVNMNSYSLAKKIEYLYDEINNLNDIKDKAYETYLYYKKMHKNVLKDLESKIIG